MKSRRTIDLIFAVFGLALLAAAVAAAPPLLRLTQRTRPLPTTVLERAQAGVSQNSDWQPVVRRLNSLDMALVPAGCFSMGSTDLQLAEAVTSCERFYGPGRCQVDFAAAETPSHEVCFERPFWIGETEVTNRLYGSSSSTDMNSMYRAPSWPRETVTWAEAAQFCAAHNARLPREAEWEYAARGPDGFIYPWGNTYDLARLASGRLSPANVGSRPAGMSWVGAFDMSGGVAEWAADWYAPYSEASLTHPSGPANGQQRVLRGGDWFSFAAFLVRTAQRKAVNPETANSTIGFRCARDLD